MVELHRDESDWEERAPDTAPRFSLGNEALALAQIGVCRVGQAFMVELVFGEPPRPRVAINKPVIAIIPAMSQ